LFILIAFIGGGMLLQAQDSGKQKDSRKNPDANAQTQPAAQEQDPLKRPVTKKQQEGSKPEKMGKYYKKWLDEDVRWIITGDEEQVFKKLSNDAERDQFIEAFWQRRDPTPDTEENEYKDEHYRRLAYATEVLPQVSPVGGPIAAACTSCMASRIPSIPILQVGRIPVLQKRVADRPRPFLSKNGAIAIWKASGRKSKSSSWILAVVANTT